jgi:D-3-phosphoglycerate dehydrogenase
VWEGTEVSENVDNLILDLLEWIGPKPRPYSEVMDAWRTSCPKLPVWEEANDRGFVVRQLTSSEGVLVGVSAEGAQFLLMARPLAHTHAQ